MDQTESHQHPHAAGYAALTLGALGVVFGDIGTSPLYTLKECLHAAGGVKATHHDLFGILSLIFWSLTMVVTVKYLIFIMRADNKGEGGIFALLALVPSELRTSTHGRIRPLAVLAIIGAALLYGDGIITPAISVLGAVEGLSVADPSLSSKVVPIAVVILVGLFSIQSRGTGTVGNLFGPVMLVWFATLAALGLWNITHHPQILQALSPHYGVEYLGHHGWQSTHILASVVLAVTGGEALYADMGHFGIRPIRSAWLYCVMPALVINYFGQGALVLANPQAALSPFFAQVPTGVPTYLLVGLSSAAAVIASQALISGAFSLTRQATLLGYFPRLTVRHTAHHTEGQIYIPQINAMLAVGCVLLVLTFRTSSNLAAAYGIAVTGTMAITSMMYYLVVRGTWKWSLPRALALLVLFLTFDFAFLFSNLSKFMDGGYVPVLVGAAFVVVMVIWARGRSLVAIRYSVRYPSTEFAQGIIDERLAARVPGTAVFMSSNPGSIPHILVRYVERSRSLHENVILLHVAITPNPVEQVANRYEVGREPNGFHRILIRYGFMENPEVPAVLEEACRKHGIPFEPGETTYYLGRESFVASSRGRMGEYAESTFAFLQRNSVPADRYFGLPHRQVVEIGTQMDL
ncbi:MAG: potassium transporter Kup [Bryobacteraceae bacterium]|nr:potassium transporter Kup [Bryobacteraceae bacterium]